MTANNREFRNAVASAIKDLELEAETIATRIGGLRKFLDAGGSPEAPAPRPANKPAANKPKGADRKRWPNKNGPSIKDRIVSALRENGKAMRTSEIAAALGVDISGLSTTLRREKGKLFVNHSRGVWSLNGASPAQEKPEEENIFRAHDMNTLMESTDTN